ncbi:MAG TPA: carbohydrate-binding protein, partial [Verrucomicrobiae bacterium]
LIVGNSAPEVRFVEPRDGDFFTPGKPLHYKIFVKDAEDGNSFDYEETFEPRTFVNATWGKGDGKLEASEPGLALMKQNDCFNCHAVEQKIVGPPLIEVAKKYHGQTDALEASVQRVLKGSSKVWGDVPMLPHEALNPDQVRMMVRWVYGLKPGQGTGGLQRGLLGEVKVPNDQKLRSGVLEATYTDLGRAPAGSLSGKASVKLRSRRLEAELADEKKGAKVLGSFLGGIDHGNYARFNQLNLTDSASVTFHVSSAGQGGKIELHSGSVSGPLLATVEVQPTGSWDKWKDLTVPMQAPTNRADIYALFVNPGKGGLMNLDWLQFNPR